jgi:hypothetical protein
MNVPRLRFAAALGLFALWIAALVGMIVVSSQPPREDTERARTEAAAAVSVSLPSDVEV